MSKTESKELEEKAKKDLEKQQEKIKLIRKKTIESRTKDDTEMGERCFEMKEYVGALDFYFSAYRLSGEDILKDDDFDKEEKKYIFKVNEAANMIFKDLNTKKLNSLNKGFSEYLTYLQNTYHGFKLLCFKNEEVPVNSALYKLQIYVLLEKEIVLIKEKDYKELLQLYLYAKEWNLLHSDTDIKVFSDDYINRNIEKTIESLPSDLDPYTLIELLDIAISIDQYNLNYILKKGEVLENLKHYDKALNLYENALKKEIRNINDYESQEIICERIHELLKLNIKLSLDNMVYIEILLNKYDEFIVKALAYKYTNKELEKIFNIARKYINRAISLITENQDDISNIICNGADYSLYKESIGRSSLKTNHLSEDSIRRGDFLKNLLFKSQWIGKKHEIQSKYAKMKLDILKQNNHSTMTINQMKDEITELSSIIDIYSYLIEIYPNNAKFYYSKASTIQLKVDSEKNLLKKLSPLNKKKTKEIKEYKSLPNDKIFENKIHDIEIESIHLNDNKDMYNDMLRLYDTALRLDPKLETCEFQIIFIKYLIEKFDITRDNIYTHKDYKNTVDFYLYSIPTVYSDKELEQMPF